MVMFVVVLGLMNLGLNSVTLGVVADAYCATPVRVVDVRPSKNLIVELVVAVMSATAVELANCP